MVISRWSSPMPARSASPVSLFVLTDRDASAFARLDIAPMNFGRSFMASGSMAFVTTGSE